MMRFVPMVCLALVAGVSTGRAGPFDDRPKVLVHVSPVVAKNPCGTVVLSDCAQAVTSGALYPGNAYYAYVMVARGNRETVAGVQFGIDYQGGVPGGALDGAGLDLFDWILCGTLEFRSTAFPNPGGGELVTWDPCRTEPVLAVGYFYAAAYGADTLRITPRPVDCAARVAGCRGTSTAAGSRVTGYLLEELPEGGVALHVDPGDKHRFPGEEPASPGRGETDLAATDLGSAVFSPGGGLAGCNPCVAPCSAGPVPGVPEGLVANSLPCRTVALTWDPVPSADGYRVYRNGLPVSPFPYQASPSFTDTDPETVSCYSVTSVACRTGESPPTSPLCFTPSDTARITIQPADTNLCLPEDAILDLVVLAEGTGWSYAWRRNGEPLNDGGAVTGSSTPHLVIDPVTFGDAGSYDVVVSGPCGSTVSDAAAVGIFQPPALGLQPLDQRVAQGNPTNLHCGVSSGGPVSYQWYREGVALSNGGGYGGTTTPILAVQSVSVANAGYYHAVVSNPCGEATTRIAELIAVVCPNKPVIQTQPASQSVILGEPATFTVLATGCQAVEYQWRKNAIPIAGATQSDYTIAAVQAADAGAYNCQVTSGGQLRQSDYAHLNISLPQFVRLVDRPLSCDSILLEWETDRPTRVTIRYGASLGLDSTWVRPEYLATGSFVAHRRTSSSFLSMSITIEDVPGASTTVFRALIYEPTGVLKAEIRTYPFYVLRGSIPDGVQIDLTVRNGNCQYDMNNVVLMFAYLADRFPWNVGTPLMLAPTLPVGESVEQRLVYARPNVIPLNRFVQFRYRVDATDVFRRGLHLTTSVRLP